MYREICANVKILMTGLCDLEDHCHSSFLGNWTSGSSEKSHGGGVRDRLLRSIALELILKKCVTITLCPHD